MNHSSPTRKDLIKALAWEYGAICLVLSAFFTLPGAVIALALFGVPLLIAIVPTKRALRGWVDDVRVPPLEAAALAPFSLMLFLLLGTLISDEYPMLLFWWGVGGYVLPFCLIVTLHRRAATMKQRAAIYGGIVTAGCVLMFYQYSQSETILPVGTAKASSPIAHQVPLPRNALLNGWCNDSSLLVYDTDEQGFQFQKVDVATGGSTPLATVGRDALSYGSRDWDVSPDGNYLLAEKPNASNWETISLETGKATVYPNQSPNHDTGVNEPMAGWLNDGSHWIEVYTGTSSTTLTIHDAANPTAPPRKIVVPYLSLTFGLLTITAQNKIVFFRAKEEEYIEVDIVPAKPVVRHVKLVPPRPGLKLLEVSPQFDKVAWYTRHDTNLLVTSYQTYTIWVAALDGSAPRQLGRWRQQWLYRRSRVFEIGWSPNGHRFSVWSDDDLWVVEDGK